MYPKCLLHQLSSKDEQLPHYYFYEQMIKDACNSKQVLDGLSTIMVH